MEPNNPSSVPVEGGGAGRAGFAGGRRVPQRFQIPRRPRPHQQGRAADPESGITKYWFAIGSTPGAADVVDWTDNGLDHSTKTGPLMFWNVGA